MNQLQSLRRQRRHIVINLRHLLQFLRRHFRRLRRPDNDPDGMTFFPERHPHPSPNQVPLKVAEIIQRFGNRPERHLHDGSRRRAVGQGIHSSSRRTKSSSGRAPLTTLPLMTMAGTPRTLSSEAS